MSNLTEKRKGIPSVYKATYERGWQLKNLGYDWSFSQQFKEREIDVFVDNIEYKDGNHPDMNGYWEDPDIQLCNHYGIDYDQVNCLESLDYED